LKRPLKTAITGLSERNTELCEQVEADDEEVDILEKQIDQEEGELLIRFHPVASDMREAVSAMKDAGSRRGNWLIRQLANWDCAAGGESDPQASRKYSFAVTSRAARAHPG